jgi:hypothetical protein
MMKLASLVACLTLLIGGAADAHWREVDISESGNACAAIQAALNPYLIEPLREPGRHYRVKVTGTATVSFDQLHRVAYQQAGRVREDGPYRYCFGLFPSRRQRNGYPVSDGSHLSEADARLTLWWDAAEIRFDAAGQDLPVVIYGQGDGYVSGYGGGGINGGLVEYGFLEIRMIAAANSPGFGEDRVVPMASHRLFESATTTVGLLSFRITRANVAGLTLRINGHSPDRDDIGIVHIDSWGMRRTGGTHLRELHTGLQVYGNANMTLGQAYFPWNTGPNLVLGDPVNGAGVRYFERCTTGNCDFRRRGAVGSLTVRDSVIEGTNRGLLLAFGGCKNCQFVGNHFEQGKRARMHAILIGAGQCGVEDAHRVCGSDRECPESRVCQVPSPFWLNRLFFVGGGIGSDSGFEQAERWSPIYFGKGATAGEGTVFFENGIGKDKHADGRTYYFGFDPAARVRVDFSRAVPQSSRMLMPAYPHVVGVPR